MLNSLIGFSLHESFEDDLRQRFPIAIITQHVVADLVNDDPHMSSDYIAYMLDTAVATINRTILF